MIKYMFKPEPIKKTLGENPKITVGYYFICKFLMTILSLSCPIPCGVFTPMFSAGAAIGRFFGEFFFLITEIHPGVYALVGAAALTSSVTHTISVIVIVFELSGQISYLPFMLVGVLTSYSISNLISSSIYDLLITLKKIPYMPSIKNTEIYTKHARDIMNDIKPLHNVTSLKHI